MNNIIENKQNIALSENEKGNVIRRNIIKGDAL